MTATPAAGAVDQTCPYLGLADDPATHFTFPSHAQRCHSARRPITLGAAKQARDCLTSRHVSCSRYRPPAASPPGVEMHRILEMEVTARSAPSAGHAPAGRRITRLARAAILAGLLGAAIVTGLLFGSWLGSGVGADGASQPAADPIVGQSAASSIPAGSPTAPAGTAVASTSPASPSPASPSPSPSAQATPSPGPSASPSAAQSVTHVVRRGETLTSIAARYGVSVKAIQDANAIEDPNVILVGQRLVIPLR